MAPAVRKLSSERTSRASRRAGSEAGRGARGEEPLRAGQRGSEPGFTIVELLVATLIIAIIGVIGLTAIFHAMDKARQRATMADMRILSKAIEAYREDSSAIPTDDGGITALVTVLSPDDSLLLPTRDHWSHTYTYVSDGAGNYTIESHGKDGADGPNITLGSRFDFDLDIVLSNGVFVAAPE